MVSQINSILAENNDLDLLKLSSIFHKKSEDADKAGDIKNYQLFMTLAMICHMALNPDDKIKPFKPFFINYQDNTRTPDVDDLVEEQLTILEDVYTGVRSAVLKSRIADVLWVRKRNHKAAKNAIESYVECFNQCINENDHHEALKYIERAIRLVYHTGLQKIYLSDITTTLEAIALTTMKEREYFFYSKILIIILSLKSNKLNDLAKSCRRNAEAAKNTGDWHWEQDFYEIEANFHRKLKNKEDEINALNNAAETLERRGYSCMSTDQNNCMSAAHWLSQAIDAYRKIPGGKEKANAIHSNLLKIQNKIPSIMVPIEYPPINLTEGIHAIENALSGKNLFHSLYTLAFFIPIPDFDKEKNRAKELTNKFPLQSMFGKQIITSDGRVTGRVPSAFSDSEEDRELHLWDQTIGQIKILHQLHVNGFIKPGITQICREHHFRYQDFFPFLIHNPFIPIGREIIYAKGFYYGLCLEWIESCHLLIPQIENSLRYILSQHGIETSCFDSDGIQDTITLNKILDEPKLIELFGNNLILDLKVLLIDRCGYNLRNEIAHGLLQSGAFNSDIAAYLWWIALRLVMISNACIINEKTSNEKESGYTGNKKEGSE